LTVARGLPLEKWRDVNVTTSFFGTGAQPVSGGIAGAKENRSSGGAVISALLRRERG
jgi:hypothetical protein